MAVSRKILKDSKWMSAIRGTTMCVEWKSAPSTNSKSGNEINTFLTYNGIVSGGTLVLRMTVNCKVIAQIGVLQQETVTCSTPSTPTMVNQLRELQAS